MEIFIALVLVIFFGLFVVLSLPIGKDELAQSDHSQQQRTR